MTFDNKWYYFGCKNQPGHYLFDKTGNSVHIPELEKLDGELCLEERKPYVAVLTRIPHLQYSALAWWDYTIDTRPGSNSILFSPSLVCQLSSFHAGLLKWFPWVEKRLPQPLVCVIPERIYDGI